MPNYSISPFKLHLYTLQSAARALARSDDSDPRRWRRVSKCGFVPHKQTISVAINSTFRHKYTGLITCGSVWECPVCSDKIARHRRKELRSALWLASNDYQVFLVTYTVSHSRNDLLSSARWHPPYTFQQGLLERFLDARRYLYQRPSYKELQKEYGAEIITSLEVTWGADNGWHPHLHALWLLRKNAVVDLGAFARRLYEIWVKVLAKFGLSASAKHGVDVRSAKRDIADYVSKFGRLPRGWDVDSEITGQAVKRGRSGDRFSPMELLEQYVFTDDPLYASLWLEYARAFFGRQQFTKSPHLWKKLGVKGYEFSDSEIADDFIDPSWVALFDISIKEWRVLRANNELRLGFLGWLDDGNGTRSRSEVDAWLVGAGVRVDVGSPVGV